MNATHPNLATPAVDGAEFRRCLAQFVTGVTIITATGNDGTPCGVTANSFTSVSFDPPLILVCIGNTSRSLPTFLSCTNFSVNILSESQMDISGMFAGKVENKFGGIVWRPGLTGAPNIGGCLAIMDCDLDRRIEAGDHVILIGLVRSCSVSAQRPLIFGQGNYISLGIQQDALSRSRGRDLLLSCIAEFDGKILLCKENQKKGKSANWTLPSVYSSEATGSVNDALEAEFRRIGISIEVSFIYSIYEALGQNAINMIYRGSLLKEPKPNFGMALFSESDLPWERLDPSFEPHTLRRFFREKSFEDFGVYFRAGDVGQVAKLGGRPMQALVGPDAPASSMQRRNE